MKRSMGFTLIELMVVILIIAILAAVLAPMLTGRINEAKWTEGRAGAGTIATALRAYMAEHEGIAPLAPPISGTGAFVALGITDGDLEGKYFAVTNYTVTSASYSATTGACAYVITVTAPTGITPASRTLTTAPGAAGVWAP